MDWDTTYTCANCGGPLAFDSCNFHFVHEQKLSRCTAVLAKGEVALTGTIHFDAGQLSTGM